MSLNKFYQIDIFWGYGRMFVNTRSVPFHQFGERVESTDLETAIEESIKLLDNYEYDDSFVHDAYMIIGKEKVIIKQKVIDLINRRKNGKSRLE